MERSKMTESMAKMSKAHRISFSLMNGACSLFMSIIGVFHFVCSININILPTGPFLSKLK